MYIKAYQLQSTKADITTAINYQQGHCSIINILLELF